MIKINDKIVQVEKFPDGTPRIKIDVDNLDTWYMDNGEKIRIKWFYESNDEIFYLMLIKRHLESNLTNVNYHLYLPYVPNGRMDRTKNSNEVFTLKYFCDFINWLNFSSVSILDAHSDVSTALLNNCFNANPKQYIKEILCYGYVPKDTILYFPDNGAAKRYSELFPDVPYCYGEKNRDWKTGKILGLDVRTNGIELKGKDILMIDDICSYGGSFSFSAKALKELGVNKIYAYATHTENSVLDHEKGTLIKSLEDGTVERLFTTNSLFTGKHDKITVLEV